MKVLLAILGGLGIAGLAIFLIIKADFEPSLNITECVRSHPETTLIMTTQCTSYDGKTTSCMPQLTPYTTSVCDQTVTYHNTAHDEWVKRQEKKKNVSANSY